MRYFCPYCYTVSEGELGSIRLLGPNSLLCLTCGAKAVRLLEQKSGWHWGQTWEQVEKLLNETRQRSQRK